MKYDWHIMNQPGVTILPFDDAMLMSYALDAGRTNHGMDELSESTLATNRSPIKRSTAYWQIQSDLDQVGLEQATAYAAEDASTLRLWGGIEASACRRADDRRLRAAGAPLIDVIARMENAASP